MARWRWLGVALVAPLAMAVLVEDAAADMHTGDTLETGFLLHSYYSALMPAESDSARAEARAQMGALLQDGALIELRDIGITQTRDEFLESLDQWFDAMQSGRIAYRPDGAPDPETAQTIVCYDFGTSQALNRETFAISGAIITGSVQERIADDCSNF